MLLFPHWKCISKASTTIVVIHATVSLLHYIYIYGDDEACILASVFNPGPLTLGPAWCQGSTLTSQAWTGRRCMSIFNAILRKHHQPRELEIQSLIKDLKLQLAPKPSCDDVEAEDDDCVEENPESEEEETDDECHLSDFFHLFFIYAKMCFSLLLEKKSDVLSASQPCQRSGGC